MRFSGIGLFWMILLITLPVTVIGQTGNATAFFEFEGRPQNDDFLFDRIFLRDSTYIEEMHPNIDSWMLKERLRYTYNNQGKKIMEFRESRQADKWVRISKTDFSYDSNQSLDQRVIALWNSESQTYVPGTRERYYYNYAGLVFELMVENQSQENWRPYALYQFEYDDAENLIEEVHQYWSSSKSSWNREKRILYSYDNKKLLSEVHQIWVDSLSHWRNLFSEIFEYDEEDRLVSKILRTWNPVSNQWESESVESLNYDDKGYLTSTEQFDLQVSSEPLESVQANYTEEGNLGHLLFLAWNDQNDTWEAYRKQTHFWSQYITGNLVEAKERIDCLFANPYTRGLPWHCKALKDNVLYTLEVYDLQGRLYHAQQFQGSDTFRINASIPDGLYQVVIRGGLDLHSEKVLFRN
jgi:hypothetical protein